MKTVVGVFKTRGEAQASLAKLDEVGIADSRIRVLTPETSEAELARVPTVEGEQPGMGAALGAAVGGAMGVAGGAGLGTAIAAAFLPGIGPVLALGLAGATIGVVGGATAGAAIEKDIFVGLPQEELYIYEDALRQRRTVVIAMTDNEPQAELARRAMEEAGAESVDRAREMWWIGLRDVEKEHYEARGGDFAADEANFRAGFECAQDPSVHGRTYTECREQLRKRHPDKFDMQAFRDGFARGSAFCEVKTRKPHAASATPTRAKPGRVGDPGAGL
jgi:hypothetical protein